MKVLSLFSGGGLGDYGLESAGMEIVGQVEIDDYCQKVLALRWPHVPKWKDVRNVHTKENCPVSNANSKRLEGVWAECDPQGRKNSGRPTGLLRGAGEGDQGCQNCITAERIDLISGGFPCQDISTAGKGAGITGARSGLWKEMFRIIREVRPRYVLVENVTALLGRGLGAVLGDLAEIGYDAEWDCIPASALGAPHQRDRVWIVAHTRYRCGRDSQPGSFGINGKRKDAKTKWTAETAPPSRPSEASKIMANPKGRSMRNDRKNNRQTDRKINAPINPGLAGRTEKISDTNTVGRDRRAWMFGSGGRGKLENGDWWAVEPNVGRVAHGVAKRVDRLKLLGNGQVVQVVQFIGEKIIQFDQAKQSIIDNNV